MSTNRPLIGLSCYREQARWGAWHQETDLLAANYAQAIERAGGIPVLLPPSEPYADSAAAVVSRLDGLVISGGADVSPARYGDEPGEHTVAWRDDRDAWELELLTAADAVELPVLGVCRGMQVMAVHAGGHLNQHVPDVVGHDQHNPGPTDFGPTPVTAVAGTRLASIRPGSYPVPCHHHQSVRDHPGFVPAARADDGLLEAIERPGDRFVLAVQWHPEVDTDNGEFVALVAAASAGRTR